MAESQTENSSLGPVDSARQYMTEVRGEVRKVTWPTREEAIKLTGIVIAVTIIMTILLYLFDYVFAFGLENIVDLILQI